MIKRFLSLSVLIAILWGCCSVEDTPQTEKKETPATYKVVFDANGGSGEMADMSFTYDVEQALTANTFTREGYTFAGWAITADGDVTYADEQKVSNLTAEDKATVTLYAVWNAEEDKPTIIKTYTVKFDSNGGNGTITDQVFTYDVEQALTANTFTREGYTFAGWAITTDGTATYADMAKVKNLTAENKATVTLFAVWNENDKVLPVIFSVASETAVDYGDSVTLSCDTEEVKISYTIDGVTAEYTDAIVITKDVTITAFATKDGMKKSDTTTASYTVKTYTVTYKSDYGTVPVQINGLKKGDTLTEAQLTGVKTTGYTFAGWYNGESELTTEYKIICDLELSAKWNVNTYTVKFNANGGSGETADMSFNYDEEKALTKNTFTRKDYTFAGWAVKADGNATYADMAKVKNLTAEDKATVILYAVWNENDKVLPVIFSLASETAVDCGDSVTLSCATDGAKISYTIVDETVEYTDAITITKDVTITAFATKDGMKDSDESTVSYTVKTYTVTYTTEYGVAPSKIDGLKKGDTLTAEELPVLTTDGYTFAGWYNGENEVTTEYKISSDLNLTAKWNVNTDTAYKVEHYQQNIADDEYILTETDTETGTTDEDTSATAKTYAGFTAKSVTQEKIAADGSTVVKIYYDRNTITLTLDLDGGDGEKEITGKYGADVTTPANPTKTGYTFAGWNPSLPATFPAENVTYTAKWNANTDTAYTVEHYQQNIADNEYTLAEADTENKTGTTDTDTVATAKDYAGFTAKSVTQEKIAANGSTVVKIYYDRKEITLILDLDGGEGETEITGKYGAAVTTPANPTKIGYTFAGWNPDLPATLPAENATYTAKWTANNYIVKFEANGGSEIMTDQVFTYDMKQALTANTFTCEDYEFAGWATSADGEKVYTDGQTVLNLTSENNATVILYAVWEIENYTITYNLNGGTNAESNPTNYTVETDTIILANATRNGYAFLGWYDENGDKVTQIPSDTAKDITVTAKWWYSVNFVYVQGATITGVIPGDGYKDSGIFKAGETVTVGDFYMCDHEVTQAEYEKYCTYGGDEEPETNGYNYPAYYVNWFDALVYCNKRSIAEGLTPCYTINDSINPTYWGSIPDSEDHANFNSWMAVTCNFEANGYRLPKEVEWEYAARGGNGLTGYQYSHAGCSHTVDDVAWYNNNSKYSSNKVKGKKANGLGLYDMSGNVSEWCWDTYSVSSRYLRGGSWNYPGNSCTVSYRDHISAYYRDSCKGFRVVRTAN